jgi:hypothetical protein
MAFSNSSYFAGVGTAFAAIALGFAGGAMITTSAVQPPNRLERVASNAAHPSSAPSSATPASSAASSPLPQQASVTPPAAQEPPQSVAAVPHADSSPVQQPQPATPVAAKIDAKTVDAKTLDTKTVETKTDTATNTQQPPPSPPQAARNEDTAPAKSDRANARSPDRDTQRPNEPNRDASRKRRDERKLSKRRRRQDLERQNLDEATNVVRPMPHDRAINQVVEEEDAPRIINDPPRRFGLFENDEDSPRAMPPPRFGLFGN